MAQTPIMYEIIAKERLLVPRSLTCNTEIVLMRYKICQELQKCGELESQLSITKINMMQKVGEIDKGCGCVLYIYIYCTSGVCMNTCSYAVSRTCKKETGGCQAGGIVLYTTNYPYSQSYKYYTYQPYMQPGHWLDTLANCGPKLTPITRNVAGCKGLAGIQD